MATPNPLISSADLQASVADYLNRTDLTVQIPLFITLVDAELSRRLQFTTTRKSITITAAETNAPGDMSIPRSLVLVTTTSALNQSLEVCTEEQLNENVARATVTTGTPLWVCYERTGIILVGPAPDTAYQATLSYIALPGYLYQNLSGTPTLATFNDVYLYGTLMQAERYLEHFDAAENWKRLFDMGIDQIQVWKDRIQLPSRTPIRLPYNGMQ